MPMPGGWTMSMTWVRMPQQTWLGAAASFLGMWITMMMAMMLPSLVPALRRYRQSVGIAEEKRIDRLTVSSDRRCRRGDRSALAGTSNHTHLMAGNVCQSCQRMRP